MERPTTADLSLPTQKLVFPVRRNVVASLSGRPGSACSRRSPITVGSFLSIAMRLIQGANCRPTTSWKALLNARVGVDLGLHDLQWVSYFKMHKRTAARLADGRRFLLGHSAHLSSPLGGEGLNWALMDAADICLEAGPGHSRLSEADAARQLRGRARDRRPPCA